MKFITKFIAKVKMAIYKISKGKAASQLYGYGAAGQVSGSFNVPSISFFSGQQQSFSFTMPNPSPTSGVTLMTRFTGHGTAIDNKWVYVPGALFVRRNAPSYDVQVSYVRNASTITVLITLYNNTFSSTQITNAFTVEAKALLFAPPW